MQLARVNLKNGLQFLPISLDRGPMSTWHIVDRDFNFHFSQVLFSLYVMPRVAKAFYLEQKNKQVGD